MAESFNAVTRAWHRLLSDLLTNGKTVSVRSAGADWAGSTTKELLGYQTRTPMLEPVVVTPNRRLLYRFMAAEAAWIASGDNRLTTIKPYAPKNYPRFSDDGVRFFGAYGPRFTDQLSYVTTTLTRSRESRQGVSQVWREQPRSSNDVPCTLSWQWLIRDDRLHCIATMRSSDAWHGWPYDVFNFSVLSAVVALELHDHHGVSVELGDLILTAGSQHLYRPQWEAAGTVVYVDSEGNDSPTSVAPLDLTDFTSAEDLIEHLWRLARKEPVRSPWLREVLHASTD